RDIEGQQDAYVAERDLSQGVFKPLAMFGTGRRGAEITINDLNGRGRPAQLLGALLEGVLHPEAFLIAQDLLRTGLPDVDERFATEMSRGNQFGCGHGSPPGRWLRGWYGWWLAGQGQDGARERR